MRHLAVLAEDRSSVPLLERIVRHVIEEKGLDCTFKIHPHRGKGYLPKDFKERPNPRAGGILNQLPAKLRAYQAVFDRHELMVAVVFDADNDDVGELYGRCVSVFRQEAPDLIYCIAIAVEEFEAWLLGDFTAILKAYPNADREEYEKYKQDSICGTWEHLARVIHGKSARSLIAADYPAVGISKIEWSRRISPYMDLDNNRSPSFNTFVNHLRRSFNFWHEANNEARSDG